MAERFNAAVLKTVGRSASREFESLSLRHFSLLPFNATIISFSPCDLLAFTSLSSTELLTSLFIFESWIYPTIIPNVILIHGYIKGAFPYKAREKGVFMPDFVPYAVVLAVVVLVIIGIVHLYNNMVALRNRCDNAWQTIDTQLQRRSDLIPNLVETVKGYASHESKTLEAVIAARQNYVSASTPEQVMDATNQITGTLRQLFALAESYPDLKANTNFQQLQTDLSDTEDKISYARQSYNDCVLNYNNAIQTFPGNLVAGIGHFTKMTGFTIESSEVRQAPKVSF